MAKVLIVDDEAAIRESLAFMLDREGLRTAQASTLAQARAGWEAADLVILDLGLPDGSGLDLLRAIRERVPVLVLTSRDEEADRVAGLELGADDYVTKPFSPREVAARVRAILRRASGRSSGEEGPTEKALEAPGALRIDLACRRAEVAGKPLELSKIELDLLATLARSPGRVFERATLLERLWTDAVVGDRTVDTHVKELRRKIAAAGGDSTFLETVRGVGYRWREGAK